ncbi:MAG: 50S ribosomal protein L18 [Deltaproteobacteria bacterium CG11_big_fil_rev_8_21_14_0_20_47_16]|nr:MAG: 50S ribosomal protein L18 [Deltaproteobacteria bacterium CG11_big_fil_rev_8_21_14_0_20_47_16]
MSSTVRNNRLRRKYSIRLKMQGTEVRPRLSVFRSNKHVYAQIIDDHQGSTIVAASTLDKEIPDSLKGVERAKHIGGLIAERAKAKKVEAVVFDRNGFLYHGQIKAVADGAREKGLKF